MKYWLFSAVLLLAGSLPGYAQLPRLLILTDIGGDPDDQQSMIRLLLHANEFDIEGLIASASGTPGEVGRAVVRPDLIEELVRAYGEVVPRLQEHDPQFPALEQLLPLIKSGNPHRGWDRVGEGNDTEGSEWIIQMTDRPDPRPLNICIWGGQTDLAQALWKVKNTRSAEGYQAFVSRLRIYDIADQDGIFDSMWAAFPELFYVLNKAPEGADKREAAFRGMYLGGPEELTSLEWLNANVIERHGPLGALYPQKTWTAPNPHSAMKEGDTPSWFFFLRNGLNDACIPEYGGWGGRFKPAAGGVFRDAADRLGDTESARVTVWRWRTDFQNELAVRMDWCVHPYEEANHHPVWKKTPGLAINTMEVEAGRKARLKAPAVRDPDGDDLSFDWFFYPEAGSYPGEMPDLEAKGNGVSFRVPRDAAPGTAFHLILRVSDNGGPPLSIYRRFVLKVE